MENKNVLIVDDEPANVFLLEGLLEANQYNSKSASDGVECLELLKEYIPDVILLDIMMPNKSGVETLIEIKNDENLKDIPVIMVSAKTLVSEIERCLNYGAMDYVKKPFEEVELIARLNVAYDLRQKELKLKSKISQKEDFIRMVSHDLRSPFTTVQGFAELLINDDSVSSENKEKLQYIVDSVNFSVNYFNKLLYWSKLEEGNISLQLEEVNLTKMIDFSIQQYNTKLIDKKITIIKDIPNDILINADDVFFKQVINNLLSNAIKFTPQNLTITIKLDELEEYYYLNISDEGVGIPKEIRDKLFQNSIVKSSRGTSGEKGTGIGLFICHKVCIAHDFEISIKDTADTGTCFSIRIKKTT